MAAVMRNLALRRPVTLKGERVTLRTARTADQGALERLRADPEIDYFMGVDSSPANVLWRHVYLGDQSGALVDLAIIGTQDQPIGLVSLWDRTIPHQAAELSIWVGEGYRNGGSGTEALQLTLGYAFGELKLHKIYLRVLEYNTRAIRTYEKVGFRVEGVLRDEMKVNGRWHALVYMGLLTHEYAVGSSQ